MVISAVVSLAVATLAIAAGTSIRSLHARPAAAAAKEITTIVTKQDPAPRPLPPKVVTVFQDIPVVRTIVTPPRSAPAPVEDGEDEQPQAAPSQAPEPEQHPAEMACPGHPEFTVEPANGCPEGDDD